MRWRPLSVDEVLNGGGGAKAAGDEADGNDDAIDDVHRPPELSEKDLGVEGAGEHKDREGVGEGGDEVKDQREVWNRNGNPEGHPHKDRPQQDLLDLLEGARLVELEGLLQGLLECLLAGVYAHGVADEEVEEEAGNGHHLHDTVLDVIQNGGGHLVTKGPVADDGDGEVRDRDDQEGDGGHGGVLLGLPHVPNDRGEHRVRSKGEGKGDEGAPEGAAELDDLVLTTILRDVLEDVHDDDNDQEECGDDAEEGQVAELVHVVKPDVKPQEGRNDERGVVEGQGASCIHHQVHQERGAQNQEDGGHSNKGQVDLIIKIVKFN